MWFSFSGNGTSSGGKQCSAPASAVGNGIVTDAFPAPKVCKIKLGLAVLNSLKVIHPSQIIHERIFREVPQAKVVITHDDDWRDVLKDDGVQTQRLTASELQEAIFDRFEIMEEDGAAFLRAKPEPIASRNAAMIMMGELADKAVFLNHQAEHVQQNESPHPVEMHPMSSPFPNDCTGQRRALLIGVSRSEAEGYDVLPTAHDDVYKMRDLLLEIYHYTPSQITILVDDGIEGHVQPTRANILDAIRKFVKDVKAGDRLYFHYSGHSTQIEDQSYSKEDGLDNCLIPLDGEMIVDNELHATLVKPLPSGSHLVAVLDTSHSGSLLNLPHYRCNRVVVPWIWRGKRNSEDLWNGVVRRNARFMTLSQTTGPALQTHDAPTAPRAPRRRSVSSVMSDPPASSSPSSRSSTGTAEFARSDSGPIANTGPADVANGPTTQSSLARLRAKSKVHLDRLRTSFFTDKKDYDKDKGSLTREDVDPVMWFLPDEAARCDSPVGQWPCNGWCRNIEGHLTATEEADEVKADVISLASCKASQVAWEIDGVSMTSLLVDLLKENPDRTLKDVLIRISHATYSLALMRYSRNKAYKKHRKRYIAHLMRNIRQLERGNRSTASLVSPTGIKQLERGNQSTPSLVSPPGVAARPSFPRIAGPRKLVQVVGERIASLRQSLNKVLQDRRYDTSSFQNPELASPRPLDMNRPWRM
ncbi:Metacaspase pca1 [Mycena sanguinolenta]|uniref:Metacaspase pca1 n=1 Tax=Mycena sanguinolenta TaxID=230812 RepID=A0A8H7DJQ4_9AGAR|nr:Metacaspase pca1 [Mycena sanguinolenta]